jgi:hypothetical protein
VVALVAIAAVWARHAWRTAVREELAEYLERAAPEIAVVDLRVKCLVYKGSAGAPAEGRYELDGFYRDLAAHNGCSAEDEAARLEVFAGVARRLRAHAGPGAAPDPFRRAS